MAKLGGITIKEETLKRYTKGEEMFLQGDLSLTKISQEIGASRKRFTEWLNGNGRENEMEEEKANTGE